MRWIVPIVLAVAAMTMSVLGCGGGGGHDVRPYGSLGTTALCNSGGFSFETDCDLICAGSGVKEWYVNCGQEGQGPTSPLPGTTKP